MDHLHQLRPVPLLWWAIHRLDDGIDEFDEGKGDIIAFVTYSTSAPRRCALLLASGPGDLPGIPQWLASLKTSTEVINDNLGVTESCRKVVTNVHSESFLMIVHEICSLHLFWGSEDTHWPRPWGGWGRGRASSLLWAPSQLKQHDSLKICQNRNRYLLRFIKCTFARVFVSIKLKSTDDINTINCQHDLWWHLITRQNIKAINRIRLSLVVNKCW